MALNDILAAMEAQTNAEIKRITAQAEQQAGAIKHEAEQQARATHERIKTEQRLPIVRERARRVNRARREALNVLGRVRSQLYAAALEQAQQRLHGLRDDPSYPAVLHKLVSEATGALDGTIVLRADPRDKALLARIAPHATIQWDLKTAGGVEARSADGRIVVNNTLEARLEQAQPQLRTAVMPLFEGT